MPRVKVSPKYQVVIPQEVREALDIRPGQEVEILIYDNRIELIPIKPIEALRGYLKGIKAPFVREEDREL